MKRTLSWLIVLAMLIGMLPTVFATEANAASVSGGSETSGPQTTTLLATTATTTNADEAMWGVDFELDAPGTGSITVTFTIADIYPEYRVIVGDNDGNWYSTANGEPAALTVDVNQGDDILISVATQNAEGGYVPGSVDFEVVFTGVIDESANGGGTDLDTVLAEGNNNLVIQAGVANSAEYAFTATEAGTLVLTIDSLIYTASDGTNPWPGDLAEFPLTFTVNGQNVGTNTTTVEVVAGDVVTVMLTQNRMYVNSGWAWEANLNVAYQTAPGGMVLGDNVLESASGASGQNTFTVTQSGTLYITVRSWTMNGVESGESLLQYGWSEILVNGTAMTAMTKSISVTAGDVVSFEITSDGDSYTAHVYLSMEDFYEEPAGSEFNPVKLYPADLPTASIEIAADSAVWYDLKNFDDYILTVTGEDAYIVIYTFDYEASWPYPLVSTYIYAENGVATYAVAGSYLTTIQIGNAGDTAATFQIDGSLPVGAQSNPAVLQMGTQTVFVEFEQFAYYFTWTAPADGTLTLTFSGEFWRYCVQNIGDPDNWRDDGEDYTSRALDDTEAVNTVTVVFQEGDVLEMQVGNSDENYDLPSGNVTITASFTESSGSGSEPENPGNENALVLGSNALQQNVEYAFTVEQAGTLELIFSNVRYDGYGETFATQLGSWVDIAINGNAIDSFFNSMEVAAGDQITVLITPIDGSVYTADLLLRYEPQAQSLVQGDNTIAQYTPYVYVAEQTGTLYFTVKGIVNDVYGNGDEDCMNWGLQLDINGQTLYSFRHSISVTEGDEITVYMVPLTYNWEATLNISYEAFYEHPLGSEQRPVELTYDQCPTVTPEIAAGAELWYELDYSLNDCNLVVRGENAYIVVNEWNDDAWAYEDVYYYAENGVVTYYVTAAQIRIGNAGTEAAVFEIEASFAPGTYNNPVELIEGDNVADVPAYQTFYFYYTATQNGTLTITVTGEHWGYSFVNEGNDLNDYSDNTYGDYCYLGQGSSNTVDIEVLAGDYLVVSVFTMDFSTYSQPAATLNVNMVFAPAQGGGETDVQFGNVNGDDTINVVDAMLILQYCVGDITENDLNMAAADVNSDGTVNVVDAMLILQYCVGDIDSFTPQE